ncbi:Gfo/Idh/MocA family oxidoreductase [Hoeflea sp. YIM 152468]|uniref:Gfo/Idh/MocA family oxidoreductase n=1 Tax=Hoeflea sp. YIM 152468 TaxID=3031759 RepID=UPI0023DCB358|nr:Gfo/Idh/MocA family oxidoreductase [Hoeflea sp. YIM 152468]MDF1610260.1 Gfo/Idh/MocA family oxidoreductase [Hoeflea sp. YIM 152468]
MTSQVRVAVVGCGYWGKNLVRDFSELGALEAVVDANADTVAALQAKHGGRALTFEQAANDAAVDAMVIAVPAHLHYSLAKQALDSGKHVYVEKPLALELSQAEELVALAEKKDLRLMVGHLLQYHPAFIALKDFVGAGKLGRLSYVYSNRLSYGILRREEDVLWSFAPHDISMVLALAGESPDHVGAFAAPTLHPVIGDFTQVQMSFPSGLKSHIFVSWLHPFKEQRLVVVGERGAVVFEDSAKDPADKLKYYAHSVEWANGVPKALKAAEANGAGIALPYGDGNPLKNECTHFLESVANRTKPRTDGAEGLRVLSVLTRASSALKAQSAASSAVDTASKPRVAKAYPGVKIHESAYVDDGADIGQGTSIWHFSHILGQVSIGEKVSVGQNVVIGPKVTVGNNVKIQNNVSLYEGVTLEDGVFCGPSCVFTNVNNPRSEISRKHEFRTTLVKRGSTIGANATIVCGHTLGEYCFIGAGAVVARDVPAFALMAGVPAKRIGWMSHAGIKLGPDLVCTDSGRRYREVSKDVLEEITE